MRNRTNLVSVSGALRRALATAPLAAALLAVVLVPAPALAQEDASDGFSGSFLIGVRSVDVSGAERKFREDYNYEDGPRLFEFRLDLSPAGGIANGAADRLFIDATNLGGDPYETLSFGVSKSQAYDFRYDRRVSEYFYEDIILPPELASLRGSTGGDFHHFDFERVHDRAQLEIDLTPRASLDFGLDRYTKTGEATTTLDFSRDEFELDRIIDESSNDYSASFEYAWDKVTLVLEERVLDYANHYELFLPGFSLGENPTGATLDFFFLEQPYDLEGNRHTARLIARPNPRLDVVVQASLDRADLDLEASERSQGTAFNGAPVSTDVTGEGEIDRDVDFFDLDVTYRFTDRVALIANAHRRDLDQAGEFEFDVAGSSTWEIQTTGGEVGLQFLINPTLTVSGGLAVESREVDFAWAADDTTKAEVVETDREGYFADLAWRPSRAFQLTLAAENNSFDDPFTLASPTDRQRYRVNARYRWETGLYLSGVYQLQDYENDNSGWNADSDRLAVRAGWGGDGLDVSLGYAMLDVEREIDQELFFGGPNPVFFPIDYEADTDLIDGRLRWSVNDRWALGGSFRTYDNDGSFALSHDDYRAWIEAGFGQGYLARVGYRMVEYEEDEFDFDDYDADMLELAIGYRW